MVIPLVYFSYYCHALAVFTLFVPLSRLLTRANIGSRTGEPRYL